MFKLIAKELNQFAGLMNLQAEATRKAAEVAVRVEAYQLMKELKSQIRAGSPGGRLFDPLTEISKRYGKPRDRKPLRRLAGPVRYGAVRSGSNFTASVGFLSEKVSKSWMRIAQSAQEGSTTIPTEDRRRGIIRMGIALRKRRDPAARFFFIRKTTRSFTTPARQIVDPFWDRRESEARAHIQANFERKMRGERI